MLRFRDRLLAAGTVEGCYMSLFKGAGRRAADVRRPARARHPAQHARRLPTTRCGCARRELFFREQKATIQDGHALLADLETVEMHASGNRYGSIGRLIVEAQGELGARSTSTCSTAPTPRSTGSANRGTTR